MLNALPAGDEVMLQRTESDALPILSFSNDRVAQRRAIAQLRMSSTNPDIPRALEAARAALAGSRRGLLVYVGPGIVDSQQTCRDRAIPQRVGPSRWIW